MININFYFTNNLMKDFDVFYLLKSHEDILMIPYDGLCFNFMDFFYRILIILDKIIKQLICLYQNFWPLNYLN